MKEDILKEAERCVKCGTCSSACPVYKETTLESITARGKLRLIRETSENRQDYSYLLEKRLRNCVQCLNCTQNCPNGIKIDEVYLKAWKNIAISRKIPFIKKIILENILLQPGLVNAFEKMYSLGGKLVTGKNVYRPIINFKFPLNKLIKYSLPEPANSPFLYGLNSDYKSLEKKTIGIFTGCLINYVFHDIANATIKIIEKSQEGQRPFIPIDQTCCSMPLITSGNISLARKLALKNISAFKGVDKIIVPCASCLSTFKKRYADLLNNNDEAVEFTEKLEDISQFIINTGLLKKLKPKIDEKVFYHHPCHLKRGAQIIDEPVDVISALYDKKPETAKDKELCCGFGGYFHFEQYDLSMNIINQTLNEIEKTSPTSIITSCPACILQISSGLAAKNAETKVNHLACVVAESLL